MTEIDMKGNPFFLDEEGEKLGSGYLEKYESGAEMRTGILPHGVQRGGRNAEAFYPGYSGGWSDVSCRQRGNIQDIYRKLQAFSNIPLLLAANTEAGGDGLAYEGTSFGKPMAVAATDDPENGYRMGYTACKEGAALGLNWSFAPIVDINYDFHNPINQCKNFWK